MSGPADNTELCPVCGLAPQVRGCNPPLRRCYSPHAYVPMGTDRLDDPCEVCDKLAYDATVHPAGAPNPLEPFIAAAGLRAPGDPAKSPEHPLPWRWEENQAHEESLVSADGRLLITAHDGVSTDSAYVRAVTERSGAMEQALRDTLRLVEHLCPFAFNFAPSDSNLPTKVDVQGAVDIARALLAEIDAAKAGL